METKNNDYHISFFNPTTRRAKRNRNLTILLVSIWVIAIFGFHTVMKLIEKPTPEPTLIEFNAVWPNIENDNASEGEIKTFAKTSLLVLGKSSITADDRAVLDNGLSWAVSSLCDSTESASLIKQIEQLDAIKENLSDVEDQSYLSAKQSISGFVAPMLDIEAESVIGKLIPLELKTVSSLDDDTKSKYTKVMNLYLVHNQSVLTDTKFLGFPFHYFYTAVFLLVLFVGLCWFYCFETDRINKKLGVEA